MLQTTMKPYIPITKEIIKFKGKSKLSDIYIYACLYSTRDFKTGISKWNQITISEKFNIPESTLQDSIQRLFEQNLILQIIQKKYKNKNDFIRKNYYRMNNDPDNFFFIDNNYFKLDIDRNIKGFVLLLKTICYNNTNTYIIEKPIKGRINISELAKKLDLDRDTVSKYTKLAINNKLIDVVGKKIVIVNECFLLRVSEEDRCSEIMSTIQDLCIKHNAIMPLIGKREITQILMKYNISESEIQKCNNTKFTEQNSLKHILENRIKSLPKDFSFDYILKVLNIPKLPRREPQLTQILMI